jgi:hypothetical protein
MSRAAPIAALHLFQLVLHHVADRHDADEPALPTTGRWRNLPCVIRSISELMVSVGRRS